jgi:hypothetical protein
MQKNNQSQFNYDLFKQAYDSQPKLAELIDNFDQKFIYFKQSEMDDIPNKAKEPSKDNTVSQMAKRATDVGAEI